MGDIAIDDLVFTTSACSLSPANANPSNPLTISTTPLPSTTHGITATPTIYDCNFESDLCKWQQTVDDTFNWTRAQGPTGSMSTGPTNDHTMGTG